MQAQEQITYNLTIRLGDTFQYITDIWIFTASKTTVARPTQDQQVYDVRNYTLPAGDYIIRLDINAQVKDTPITLNKDLIYQVGNQYPNIPALSIPPLYSSAPLESTLFETSQTYYTDAAIAISQQNTMPLKAGQPSHCGIFLFLRFPSQQIYQQTYHGRSYWKMFALYNNNKELICTFPKYARTGEDDLINGTNQQDPGYLGYSADLPPGLYFLRYSGKDAREIPIYVYRNWYTQVFITVAQEPLFGTIRIFLCDQKRFRPNDPYHLYIDICLNKIQNDDYTIDPNLLNNIAYGKYDSPMLGLLGAFLYLKSKETKDDALFRVIVQNLENKILVDNKEAPDLWALKIISREHFNEPFPTAIQSSIDGTPMLRIGYDAIRRAAVVNEALVLPGSLNDLIAEKQVFDSPFNTFTPLRKHKLINKRPKQINEQNTLDDIAVVQRSYFPSDLLSISPEAVNEPKELSDYILENKPEKIFITSEISRSLGSAKSAAPTLTQKQRLEKMVKNPKKTGWLGYAIASQLLQNEANSKQLAKLINVPLTTVERIRKKYKI